MTRKRLPTDRPSITHRVQITDERGGQFDIYIVVGMYPSKRANLFADALRLGYIPKPGTPRPKPGEVFVKVGKIGSTMRGMLDVVGIQASLLLQNGVKLTDICTKLEGTRFEPHGPTDNTDIPDCTSIVDYMFRWLRHTFT